ncbi:cellulose biosynthesis protein BcsD [Gluconacetobacter takamatsuzukensis]|uniref:Cellulose synthase n=1 Tax=Gluconacetobacter takamatsuzukensis TaxID=1286190 RepID=A0A7W4PPK9_9PROT|nr:cellulose biosynthesis protein BcsD [Gluconacetobacter takamatsuzukensis]MBB2205540.1 cellulose synthase [Gluconacetobacter takamatsuzukensis]
MSLFLREFASGFDEQVGQDARNRFLRTVGANMAARLALPRCDTVEELELEINALLSLIGWGQAGLTLDRDRQCLQVRHRGLPRIGALGAPAGYWLAACLAGMYETWIGRQPGAQNDCVMTWRPDQDCPDGTIVLDYGAVQK